MRFYVAVNLLTIQALTNGEIKVFGGKQLRPNVHIEDITDAYLHFIDNPDQGGIFNIGFENITIYEIACMVAKEIPSRILVEESSDPRSYHVDSSKILSCGFLPRKTVRDAILEIKTAFERGEIENKDHFNNLKWMKKR